MAFRALVCSKSPETNTLMAAACKSAGIRAELCPDIFSAIEKGKNQPFSCVIADWADQPETSFLLKRARESQPNRNTLAIAIVDQEPTAAEKRDNHLAFVIHRRLTAEEIHSALAKACEKMQAQGADDGIDLPRDEASSEAADTTSTFVEAESTQHNHSAALPEANAIDGEGGESDTDEGEEKNQRRFDYVQAFRAALAAALVLTAAFFLWRSKETIQYLSRTPEGGFNVLRESVKALFYLNDSGATSLGSAATEARQDAYYSRGPASPTAQTPALGVVATESNLTEARVSLPKAADFPLPVPVPVLVPPQHQETAPARRQQATIPDSMKNSPPIAPPVVVTVNAAQMMPVSVPQPPPAIQPLNEPVAVSEQAARALLIHSEDPVYPPQAAAQKLHGPVVLQAVVGRDGSVEDLKIVRGYFILGQAAIEAVKQWRFKPYTLNGHPTSTQTVLTINFQ